jgi:hypothetical protein
MQQGDIIIRPHFGNFNAETEWFGRSDPYVIVNFGGQTQQTSVNTDGGRNPKWSDALTFKSNGEQTFNFRIMDKDHFDRDDEIASGQANISGVYQRGTITEDFPALRKGQPFGSVNFTVEITGQGAGQGSWGQGQGGFGGQGQGGFGGQGQGGYGGQGQGGFGGQGGYGQNQGGYGQNQGGYGEPHHHHHREE